MKERGSDAERGMSSTIYRAMDCPRWVSVGLALLLYVLAALGFVVSILAIVGIGLVIATAIGMLIS